jgi:hypothetical protein
MGRKRKREVVVFHILCRYSQHTGACEWSFESAEKSVRTVKCKVPAQIAEHASCRNKL